MARRRVVWTHLPAAPPLRVTSPFGYRTHPVTKEKKTFHNGVDIALATGTPLFAVTSGIISSVYNGDVGGLQVVLRGDDGSRAGYAHLSAFAVEEGQRVNAGDLIGYSGATGRVTGPHLHFTARQPPPHGEDLGERVDPLTMLPDLRTGKPRQNLLKKAAPVVAVAVVKHIASGGEDE